MRNVLLHIIPFVMTSITDILPIQGLEYEEVTKCVLELQKKAVTYSFPSK